MQLNQARVLQLDYVGLILKSDYRFTKFCIVNLTFLNVLKSFILQCYYGKGLRSAIVFEAERGYQNALGRKMR